MLDRFRLDGKIALVTGASRGLGAAMAAALEGAGARVAMHATTTARLAASIAQTVSAGIPASTAGLHGPLSFAADLADTASAERLIRDVIDACGRLDILVNNAGIIRRTPATHYTDDDWDEVLAVNLTSVFRLCRSAGRHMLERGSGKIVNIASLLSFQGGINVPAYTAAKSGVAGLTRALANEWAGRGVNVNAIAPGYMQTDNTRALREDPIRSRQILDRIPAGRWGTPDDLAGAVVFLASAASDYVHGHVLVVDGGWMGR